MARRTLRAEVAGNLPTPPEQAEHVTRKTDGDNLEARSVSRTIRTVDDLLAHVEADLERYEVAASEATKWEGMSVDRSNGRPVVTELFRVFVRLRPRAGPKVEELVAEMIAAASGKLRVRDSRTASARSDRPWATWSPPPSPPSASRRSGCPQPSAARAGVPNASRH